MPNAYYKETVTQMAESTFVHKKQIGGAGEFASVTLRIEPLPPNSENEFRNEAGECIPADLIPAIEASVRQTASSGGVYGLPVTDVRVTILDGKYHEVDSNERTFAIAAGGAFSDALRKASPIVIELIMKLWLEVPEEFSGSVIGDIIGRGGWVVEVAADSIQALVPLSKLDSYETRLHDLTRGQAKCQMSEDHWKRCSDYDPDPKFPGAMAARAVSFSKTRLIR